MKNKIQIKQIILDIFGITFGNILFAIGFNVFIVPSQISSGGVSGIAIIINRLSGFPIGVSILLLNIPLFALGTKVIGYRFLIKTGISTVLNSILIDTTAAFLPHYQGDVLLSAIFGGLLTGAGLALVFMRGSTTGGSDVIGKILNVKFRNISVGKAMLVFDALVISTNAYIFKSFESMLYSIILIYVSSKIIDTILFGIEKGVMVHIITEKHTEVITAISTELCRGTTYIKSSGTYTKEERFMLMCVVKQYETSKLHGIINRIDPKAFVIKTEVTEVWGEGFKRF